MITDNSQHTTFNLNGKPISTGELKDLGQKRIAVKESYAESMSLKSPFTGLPTPIFLEHTPKIVGWCKVHVTDIGLEFQDSKIIDKTILRKLNQGKIKGASITGIAEIATCSICSSNYIECSHISGDIYEGLTCINSVVQATIVEVSLVKTPVNSECLVNIKQQNG